MPIRRGDKVGRPLFVVMPSLALVAIVTKALAQDESQQAIISELQQKRKKEDIFIEIEDDPACRCPSNTP